jgi:hypothetical protein
MPDGAFIDATGVGTGRLTVTFPAPVSVETSLPFVAYPSVAIGCGDITDGFGGAFEDDGTARIVDTPAAADLYASYDAASFRCGLGANTGAWYFPGGGTFFPNGDDPSRTPPAGSPRGTAFNAVRSSMWRADRTSESYAQYLADTNPCMRYALGVGEPVTNCASAHDSILLIRSHTGRFVKLLWIGRAPGSFVGLFAVSRADGTFAY